MKQLFLFSLVVMLFSAHTTKGSPTQIPQDSLRVWEQSNIECDPRINDLMNQLINQNRKNGTCQGYRLQIYFGSGEKAHALANKAKTDYLSAYPDGKAYIQFKSPDFIVRVGDFRTKSEALKLKKALQGQFPNAFIVADEISFPVITTENTTN